MKVGDYVRTKRGEIFKYVKYDEEEKQYRRTYRNDNISLTTSFRIEDVIKSSPNIIDLIEVGDYVNGEKVIALRKDISERDIHMNSKDNLIFTDYDIANNWYFGIDTDEIKSIVTKEQFEAMQYKVGE